MIITIIATEKITHLDGVEVRLWNGWTENGTRCKVFVHRIAVHKDEEAEQFEKELQELMPPGRVIDLRKIL